MLLMTEPSVSVIIPALNEEQNLDKLFNVIEEHQSGGVCEVIVADGGSGDNSKIVAENAGAIFVHCRRKGRAVQMNEGAARAKGGILFFLHADTLPPNNFDVHIIKEVKSGTAAGCFTLKFDEDHFLLNMYSWFTKLKTTLVRFGDQGLFVKKEVFHQTGGFDGSLSVMEDQKIVRELKRGHRVSLINHPVTTSARKYRKNGYIRLQAVFALIFILYYAGVRQDVLVHLYGVLVRS